MHKLKNFFANLKPIRVMRGATVIMTILSLFVIAQSDPNPFLAWLIGALKGITAALILLKDDDNG